MARGARRALCAWVLAGSAGSAYAYCPPQYQETMVEPYFASATAALNAALQAVDTSLSADLTFQSERLTSAIAVLTKQKALAASQIADGSRIAAQQVATGLGVIAQTERVKRARFDFGGEFGQGFSPCVVYATRSVIANRDADMAQERGTRIQSEVLAAPGRYGSAVKAQEEMREANKASCTQDMVRAGICKSVGATPGASMSVATLFQPVQEGGELYRAKSAFINNIVGIPDEPLPPGQKRSPHLQGYVMAKARKDALLSPAIMSFKELQLDYSGVQGAETGAGVPMAVHFEKEVARYAGGQENEAWTRVMAAQNERGAMVELLKIKALDLAMQARQLRQYERMEANLAALVAGEARSRGNGQEAVGQTEDRSAKNAARKEIK